jgi:hypothetical protein
MLFKASITNETTKSEDALVDQLYIFLREFVPTHLKYESKDEIEDCIQETMLYLLKRFNKLKREVESKGSSLSKVNLEKFFFNRANSYVSSVYLRKLTRYRKAKGAYIERERYIKQLDGERQLEQVDYIILNRIIKDYNLGKEKSEYLKLIVEDKLKALDFDIELEPMERIEDSMYEVLDTLSYTVIDEYLIESVTSEGDGDIYY